VVARHCLLLNNISNNKSWSERRSGAAFLHPPPSFAMAGALKGSLVDEILRY